MIHLLQYPLAIANPPPKISLSIWWNQIRVIIIQIPVNRKLNILSWLEYNFTVNSNIMFCNCTYNKVIYIVSLRAYYNSIAWEGNRLWREIFWEGDTVMKQIPWEGDSQGKEIPWGWRYTGDGDTLARDCWSYPGLSWGGRYHREGDTLQM